MNATVYATDGSKASELALPEAVFGVAWNPHLVQEVVIGMQANARAGTAHTKDRSEVRGGGKKPWRQKGTGRARHGSRRSPIWTGGGVTFGPRNEKDYSVKLNKKARRKALASVLSKKYAEGEVLFLSPLSFAEPKTAAAKSLITTLAEKTDTERLATKRQNAALIILPERNLAIEKSFRNFGNIAVVQAKDVNPVELLTYQYVIVADAPSAVEILAARISGETVTTA